MSDLIVNLNVNKLSDNTPGMGNSFGRYSGPTEISSQSNLRADVYAQQYDLLCSVKNHNLTATRLDIASKGARMDDPKNINQKRSVTEAALQAASLQAITAWTELCWRVKRAYRIAAKEITDLPLSDELGADAKRLAETLWRDDWQQLLLKLQVLLREMAVEQRERLRRAATTQGPDHPDDYVKALLHGHHAFSAAGDALAPCLPAQLDKLLARRFAPADFRLLNARMFESCVYSDPVVQDSVPAAIGRVAGADRQLVRSYLALDEQMTDVASRWLDVKKLILKLGKGRAQLLDDWKACKELRELASDSHWRIRKKPPSVSSLPDFDVQLLSLADELSTDRNCVCITEDTLPDTPPVSPDQSDLLKLVSKTSQLLSPARVSPKLTAKQLKILEKPLTVKQSTCTNNTNKITKKPNPEPPINQMNKENQVPKTNKPVNSCTHLPSRSACCDHKQKSIIFKKKPPSEEKCSHDKGQCDKKKAATCQCECPHGETSENSIRQLTKYSKLRERLRTRLKEKQKGGQKDDSSISGENADERDIAQLLNFIEGNDNTPDPIKAQKNAARKLRRQERKLEAERQKLEEVRQQQEKERLRLEQEAAAKAAEIKAQNAKAKKEKNQSEDGPKKAGPMVTIKRVMQGSNKEPTVTITLKGSTPDKDKLLFTLINGQSEDSNDEPKSKPEPQIDQTKLSKKQRKKLKKEQTKIALQAPAQKPPKRETNNNLNKVKTVEKTNKNIHAEPVSVEPKVKENAVKLSLNGKTENVLNLQMLRLPPGITITKVEGPTAERKLQLNPKTTPTNNAPPQATTAIQSNDNRSGIIVVDTVKLKQELPPTTEKNTSQRSKKNKKKKNKKVENVENKHQPEKKTGDDRRSSSSSSNSSVFTIKNPMFYQVQDGSNSEASKQAAANQQASIIKGANGMVTIRSPRLGSCNGGGGIPFMSLQAVASDLKPAHILSELKPVVQPQPVSPPAQTTPEKPFDAQQILSGLPGIEITKINKGAPRTRNDRAAFQPADVSIIPTSMSANGDVYKLFYDNADWSLESVFAPKDLKEDEILDADELELEAFKRFCQQSVPPERKEKVAYLNVKDIILKKKASEKC